MRIVEQFKPLLDEAAECGLGPTYLLARMEDVPKRCQDILAAFNVKHSWGSHDFTNKGFGYVRASHERTTQCLGCQKGFTTKDRREYFILKLEGGYVHDFDECIYLAASRGEWTHDGGPAWLQKGMRDAQRAIAVAKEKERLRRATPRTRL